MKDTPDKKKGQEKIYNMVTQRIIELLEQGEIPWQKSWRGGGMPVNFVSKKFYRGINPFILQSAGYSSPFWLSFKQVKKLGGYVKKGSKGMPVIFWEWLEKKDEETKKSPVLRYYTVFNAEQTEGIDFSEPEKRIFNPIAEAEKIIDEMPKRPKIVHKEEARAYYKPSADSINMPESNLFADDEAYYSVLFHHLTYSTGHKSRLNRHKKNHTDSFFGSVLYGYRKEELCAEMGAAFLCGSCNIEKAVIENSAPYIKSWLYELQSDCKLVVQAAAQAQKASDFILGRKFSADSVKK